MEPPLAAAGESAAAASRSPSLASQTNALLRKNLIFQKRNRKGTVRLILVPVYLCVILSVIQRVINNELHKPKYRCGCKCVDVNGTGVMQNLLTRSPLSNLSDFMSMSSLLLGTDVPGTSTGFMEPAFASDRPIYVLESQCISADSVTVPITIGAINAQKEINCLRGLPLWRNSSATINEETFKGYRKGKTAEGINEIAMAYDFQDSNEKHFNVLALYNSTYQNVSYVPMPFGLLRISRSLNAVSNAYLQFLQGLNFFKINDYSIQFVFFFSFINLQIVLSFLAATFFSKVNTAQAIAYLYIFGSGLMAGSLIRNFIEGGKFPRHWITALEIIPAFSLYRGLYELGQYAARASETGSHGMRWTDLNDHTNGMKDVLIIIVLEWLVLLPVAYYLDHAASVGHRSSLLSVIKCFLKKDPTWRKVTVNGVAGNDVQVEMEKVDIIKERETVIQVLQQQSSGYAVVCDDLKKVYHGKDGNPDKFAVQGVSLALANGECLGILGPNGAGKSSFISMMIGFVKPTSGNAFVRGFSIQNDMEKIYNSMGVCPQNDMLWETLTGREHLRFYGRLKSLSGSSLDLMIGFVKPTSGNAFVRGFSIQNDMEKIYNSMGVCPQNDMLWETLTGREHLRFYGRLKSLSGSSLDLSLRSVNLVHGGAADKQVKKYSGGMKRRLSVAISLIGDAKVVYMDEPSTGLDPASRKSLWNVVKQAKQDRAIILTTHSMEEAEALCDRLCIMVDGSLQCIGRPKEDVKIADVFRAVENFKKRVEVQAWGLADTTMEDVFVKVAKGAQSSEELS
ncbi:hypothetical protein PR202_ga15072 [Eleusine coracana subsp. coracana]|uniref:ABC transporter domain-containing protein n=1 Tax=Eleusine coracana subsp. coracana TaxID=191504 RepID=A0AAV5CI23_ELECO|nr:hypothetical protein PR202_ga15072 [Eleusine coracana subsp. coracana]